MKKVLITAGPIPAKIDSVKFITNRFKGGLAMKTAEYISTLSNVEITIVKWKHSFLNTSKFNTIIVNDVFDYYHKVLKTKADAYILAAAVANLTPSNPFAGKFPSHEYKVGEKFQIEFEIAPRIIDEIKKKYPRSCLIGYKLYDGSHEELINAARKILTKSKANAIFANRPAEAKDKKYLITQDFATIPMSFNMHMSKICELIFSDYYKTEEEKDMVSFCSNSSINWLMENYPRTKIGNRIFGTYAIRVDGGFITTQRNKRATIPAFVKDVNHAEGTVRANNKATINAPLLHSIFKKYPNINVLLHNHIQIQNAPTFNYRFPGTNLEAQLAESIDFNKDRVFNIDHHGYIAGFNTPEEAVKWAQSI